MDSNWPSAKRRMLNVRRIQKICAFLGILFLILYFVYLGGISAAAIFKYSLVIGLFFLTIDIILYIYFNIMDKRNKNKRKE